MDYKIEDNKKIGIGLKNRLNLRRLPVAIKFFNNENEIPEGMERIDEKIRHCEMVTKAADGESFYSTAEEQKCKGGSSAMGLEDVPPKILSGEFYHTLGRFDSLETAKSVVDNIPRIEEKSAGILYAPLENANFIPDVVIIITNAKNGMEIAQGIVYNNGDRVRPSFAGIQSLCADAVNGPYISGKPNVTLACSGSRAYTDLDDDELIIGLAKDNLKPLVDAFTNI
ncbi:Uncharacterized conserved protein, DUF169 family [Methanobrevibacter olleyae]|uniref:Uncharacterized conserved protein, DUF169 family n=1 Tax=Methanobrevibacter olleyae TaxID=294671 RepID=A0A1I4GK80_METOL|nr:DUF169 domain-containing protein [Methanobrevibacter olleyae]SFL29767.1 Uncharacterized conserved protein, DUF169 family [Methanobrevibacter olleyae]